MKHIIISIVAVFIMCFMNQPVLAIEPTSVAVDMILNGLRKLSDSEEFQQIEEAINLSDSLQREISELVALNRFDGFLLLSQTQFAEGKAAIFSGFAQGTQIVLRTKFLKEIKQTLLFDVVYSDDIAPNNTVFVLSHLLYHLSYPLDPRQYSSLETFSAAAMKIEAYAFIQAWNAMLKVAEQKNDAKPLSTRQVNQLLMNTRYKFAFLGATNLKADPLTFTASGGVEANENNIQAIVVTLKNSRHADIE